MATTSPLLDLPPELRLKIYAYVLAPESNRLYREEGEEHTGYTFRPALSLLSLCRQIYHESISIFRQLNIFVRIETPWSRAKLHIATEGNVPIIVDNEQATNFDKLSMRIVIDAPHFGQFEDSPEHFVILLDDLPRFTRFWRYADLSHTSLNANLRLTLELDAPYTPSYEEKRMSKKLQREMILPFGEVKGLMDTRFVGSLQPYSSIVKELHALQEEKDKSPEQCLRETQSFIDQGNAALKAKKQREALALYRRAWEAMHIVIRGRDRIEHANEFFGRILEEEPYKGKNGQQERLYLRIALVSKTCQAFYELKDYEECSFWGLRSIGKLREAMQLLEDDLSRLRPSDEVISEEHFPGVSSFGFVYQWTGLACHAMGEVRQARRLLEVARVYIQRQRLQEDDELTAVLG